MLQLHHKNRVAAEVSVKPAGWKAVGGVDIAVYGAKSGSAFDALFELKWGGNVEETLWDAWKLAALYKQGRRAWNVYLVSGAPVTTWVTAKPLARLWREGKYRSAELWRIAGTARWQPNVGPATVPAGVRIQELAAVPIQTQDKTAWELRVVRDDNTWQGMGSPPIGRVIDALDRRPSDVQG